MSGFRHRILKKIDSTIGAAACSFLGRLESLTGPQCRENGIDPAVIERILVIRPGGIGDMLMLVPLLKFLAQHMPSAEIDILCEERNADLAQLIIKKGKAVLYDRNTCSLLNRLRKARYQLVIDTEQFHNLSSVTALLSRAPLRIGFNIVPRRNSLYTHPVTYQPDGPENLQFLRLLAPIGIDCNRAQEVKGSLCDLPLPALPEQLQKLPSGSWLVVHAAAGNRYKQWPKERFHELISLLLEQYDKQIVIVGEHSADSPMRRQAHARVIDYCGKLSILETAAVIKGAELFIGCDTGLAHLAVALNTASVTLFGSSDPCKWGHSATRHIVVYHPMACAPCALFGYHKPCRDIQCMDGISTQQVFTACRQLIKN